MTNVASDVSDVESTIYVQRGDDCSPSCLRRQARRVEPRSMGRPLDDFGDRLTIDEPARGVGEHR